MQDIPFEVRLHASAGDGKVEKGHVVWTALEGGSKECAKWLVENGHDIGAISAETLTADETRPRLEVEEDGILVILRAANFNKGHELYDMVSLRMLFNDKRIISMNKYKLLAVESVEKEAANHTVKTPSTIAAHLIYNLVRNMNVPINDLLIEVEDVEDDILGGNDEDARARVGDVRKSIVAFKRHMLPQRGVLETLLHSHSTVFAKKDLLLLRESLNSMIRHIENLEALRERCQILHEEIVSNLADILNHRMYIMALMTVLFLPLGLLAGVFGVNLGGIPGAVHPLGFLVFIVLLVIVAALIGLQLRRRHWF